MVASSGDSRRTEDWFPAAWSVSSGESAECYPRARLVGVGKGALTPANDTFVEAGVPAVAFDDFGRLCDPHQVRLDTLEF